jgi:hypothetical protein
MNYASISPHQQLVYCHTNRRENLRLIEGTLAITTIYEKYFNKDFTSAKIVTKQNFTYGRYEIRAVLKKEKMLKPVIEFIPATNLERARKGQIIVMSYFQNNELRKGLHQNVRAIEETDGYLTNSNLNDFHTYSKE